MSETKKERYPLSWPAGKPRAKHREDSRFSRPVSWNNRKHSMSEAVDLIESEVRRMGGIALVISSNVKLKQSGLPYSGQAQPEDTGAAVYFLLKQRPIVFACDKFNRVECNLWSIGKTIEATRSIERWGSASIEQSFRGFMAIPERAGGVDPYQILGIGQHCTEDDLRAAYRRLAAKYHPDVPGTGSHAKWMEIQDAHNLIGQNLKKS